MNASKPIRSCNDVDLDVLLFGDEDSAQFRNISEHVESCPHCRERLSQMAGSDDQCAEMFAALRPGEGAAESAAASGPFTADQSNSQRPSRRQVKLDFLAEPSHPEMLGRLGRYEIEQVIGSGGMGIVMKGFDSELHRPVAIKVLAPHLAHSGAARQRFSREARSADSIVHEHVVAIHDVQSEHDPPFLVMEYVPGWSLQDRVDQEGPLAAAEILRIGMQAAAGLAAAHSQGVIHRDVKPANILLEKGVERARLTDFGLARAADDATLTHSGITGTPHYMSPEQARGAPADARSDLFSLGAVLFFMATGHPPFRAEQAMAILHRICHDRHRAVQSINANVPDALARTIDRLLEKKPARRFATAGDVQQVLAMQLHEVQLPTRWRRQALGKIRRFSSALVAVACTVIAAVWIGYASGWLGLPQPAREPQSAPLTAASGSSMNLSAEELRSQQAELTDAFASLTRLFDAVENDTVENSASQGSLAAHTDIDWWTSQLQDVTADLSRFELRWPPGSNFPLAPDNTKENVR